MKYTITVDDHDRWDWELVVSTDEGELARFLSRDARSCFNRAHTAILDDLAIRHIAPEH